MAGNGGVGTLDRLGREAERLADQAGELLHGRVDADDGRRTLDEFDDLRRLRLRLA
jgi:hypothetical protein